MSSIITSKQNLVYKELKQLILKNCKDYIFIEGQKIFEQALNSSLKINQVFIDKNNTSILEGLPASKKDFEIVYMENSLISSLYTTKSKPENKNLIFSIAKRPNWELNDLLKTEKDLVCLEEIQDPGNLGMIFRSLVAFGGGGIILSTGCVDPYNTKVIRASAGAIFKLPFVQISDFNNLQQYIKNELYEIVATSPYAVNNINDLDFHKKIVYLFGNEGKGLSKQIKQIAAREVKIPHTKDIESLNIAVAVSILMWETFNRRTLKLG